MIWARQSERKEQRRLMNGRTEKKIFLGMVAAIGMSIFIGCNEQEHLKKSEAMQSKEMQEAIVAERIGNYPEAIRLYTEVINRYQGASVANLQLAILLHEQKKDYLGAIFHYRNYLATSEKRSVSDFTIVSNRIEKAEQLLAAEYISTIAAGEPSEYVQLMNRYAELDKRVLQEEMVNRHLSSSNETLRAEVTRLNNKVENLLLWIARIQNSPRAASENSKLSSVVITDDKGAKKTVNTYEVRSGDSLSVIAEYVYGDRTLWPKIRDANPDVVKNDRVKAGDVLIIP